MGFREKAKQTSEQGITLPIEFPDGSIERVRIEALTKKHRELVVGAFSGESDQIDEDAARVVQMSVCDPDTGERAFQGKEDRMWLQDDVPLSAVLDGWFARVAEGIAYVNGIVDRTPTGYKDERYQTIEDKARELRVALEDVDFPEDDERVEELDDLIDQIAEYADEGGDLWESIEVAAEGIYDVAADLYEEEHLPKAETEQIQAVADGIHDVARNIGKKDGSKALVKKT